MIAALDVGTSKVTCFIAERDNQGELAIIGIGQDTAHGIIAPCYSPIITPYPPYVRWSIWNSTLGTPSSM